MTTTTKKAAKPRGVGDVASAAILAGKDNAAALAAVKKAFPLGKTGMASINWYRNALRKAGAKVLTETELKAKAAAKKKPT